MRPHRRQPTRLLRPWDSPGKNTGVGCHFLRQYMKVKIESEVTQSCPTPSNPMDCSLPGSSIHGIFQARVLEWGAIALSDPQQGPGQIWAGSFRGSEVVLCLRLASGQSAGSFTGKQGFLMFVYCFFCLKIPLCLPSFLFLLFAAQQGKRIKLRVAHKLLWGCAGAALHRLVTSLRKLEIGHRGSIYLFLKIFF